jgi:anti-sigma factor RsiW
VVSSVDSHPDLSALVRGELTNAEVAAAAAHLDRCDPCRRLLAEVATGHSLATSAARTLRSARADGAPPPDAAAVPPGPRARRLVPTSTMAAAALALVLGVVAGGTVMGLRPAPADREVAVPSPEPPERTAVLDPVEPGGSSGRVSMAAADGEVTRMTVDAAALPRVRRGQYYYVWLFDPATNKMLPLGQVGAHGTATFELPTSLLGRYTAIDVSLEHDDGDPGHSVTSVLRASYDST